MISSNQEINHLLLVHSHLWVSYTNFYTSFSLRTVHRIGLYCRWECTQRTHESYRVRCNRQVFTIVLVLRLGLVGTVTDIGLVQSLLSSGNPSDQSQCVAKHRQTSHYVVNSFRSFMDWCRDVLYSDTKWSFNSLRNVTFDIHQNPHVESSSDFVTEVLENWHQSLAGGTI